MTLSLRMGSSLYRSFQAYCQGPGKQLNRSQAFQYLIASYLKAPQIYSPLTVRELREPMVHAVSLSLPEGLHQQICGFAGERGLTISQVLRFAVYQELIINV